ncbi:Na+/H+ antiporter subunit E [Halosegnis marinus]|uniref:Na+/H+ antiporter subunit E n=1 Tax=Halosegnis marinus TaxID=3034023 RepID=A0ABD5ZRL0_9EURY|nr:Na+/H+ antiporter subunit E [Halosegnis sp. DT85]
MTRKWPAVGVALAVLWLFVRGVTRADVVGEAVIGLAVGLPLAYGLRRFYADEFAVGGGIAAAPYAVRYVAVFLRELATANVDVAYRVLSPSMPIDPDVVAVPLRVESDAAVTTIANSITLTPGTLTMDHDEATNTLYVHAIVADTDSVVAPIRTWEDYAIRIFDEDASPSDPARPARAGRDIAAVREGGDDGE